MELLIILSQIKIFHSLRIDEIHGLKDNNWLKHNTAMIGKLTQHISLILKNPLGQMKSLTHPMKLDGTPKQKQIAQVTL